VVVVQPAVQQLQGDHQVVVMEVQVAVEDIVAKLVDVEIHLLLVRVKDSLEVQVHHLVMTEQVVAVELLQLQPLLLI
tara:strand:- start:333 stop:563 length:231 start_codon:yes stop_codon:yes gene_type:complete